MKKYVILGGGTAGWIVAHHLLKWFPNDNITLVSDENIGIIGVGEATTPNIMDFLNEHEIPLKRVIEEANATIKNGVSFENWRGTNDRFFHTFDDHTWKDSKYRLNSRNHFVDESYYINECAAEGYPLNDYMYVPALSYANKVDLPGINYALHFDTSLMGKLLGDIAKERGCNHINGEFYHAELKDGKINKLLLVDGREVEGDFFFDCSGLARLLIGDVYKTKWKSYREHLPMNSAIPFWVDYEEHELKKPYTTARAMDYGWMWNTPIQTRKGYGYVYDSDYISSVEAKAEVEKLLGFEIDVRKEIHFDAGQFENVWVENCIATGLAGSFIEPLESTSIMLTIGSMMLLQHYLNDFEAQSKRGIASYNKEITNSMNHIMDFIYFHYMTDRVDTPFWAEFKEKHPPTDGVQNILTALKDGTFRGADAPLPVVSFSFSGYLQVAHGLGLLNPNVYGYTGVKPTPEDHRKEIIDRIACKFTHNRVLYDIKRS